MMLVRVLGIDLHDAAEWTIASDADQRLHYSGMEVVLPVAASASRQTAPPFATAYTMPLSSRGCPS